LLLNGRHFDGHSHAIAQSYKARASVFSFIRESTQAMTCADMPKCQTTM